MTGFGSSDRGNEVEKTSLKAQTKRQDKGEVTEHMTN